MTSIEQLSMFPIEDPFKTGTEWMKKHPQAKKEEKKKGRRRVANDLTYANFYREFVDLKLSREIGIETAEKRRLLVKYFSHRFGDKGKQPLKTRTDYQVGTIFNELMDYSEKRLGYQ